ncbi:putative toxin [Rhizobium sp. Nf11,1]|uniref:putative toxin n=1 Tax=Rhizobium sp. Nf11,1 TaxID=3404923 RepID=UPI003D349878
MPCRGDRLRRLWRSHQHQLPDQEELYRRTLRCRDRADVNGRVRIPDGITRSTLSEVKNVGKLNINQQLMDCIDTAISRGLRFDRFDLPATQRSGTLQRAIEDGLINRRDIER